jgi:hypothetical protein
MAMSCDTVDQVTFLRLVEAGAVRGADVTDRGDRRLEDRHQIWHGRTGTGATRRRENIRPA